MNNFTKILDSKYTFMTLITILVIIMLWIIKKVGYVVIQTIWQKKYRENSILLKILSSNNENFEIEKIESTLKYIHGLLLNTGIRRWTRGEPYFTWEIALHDVDVEGKNQKTIGFYIWCPKQYKKILEEHLYMRFKGCLIRCSKDYLPSWKEAVGQYKKRRIYIVELQQKLSYIFSIRERENILNEIVTSMTGIQQSDIISVQFVVKPLSRSWQGSARGLVKKFEKEGLRPGEKQTKGNMDNLYSTVKDSMNNELREVISEQFGHKMSSKLPYRNLSKISNNGRTERAELRKASEKVLKDGFEVEIRLIAFGSNKYTSVYSSLLSIIGAFNKLADVNYFGRRNRILGKYFYYRQIKNRAIHIKSKSQVFVASELSSMVLNFPDMSVRIPELTRNNVVEFPIPQIDYMRTKKVIGDMIYRGKKVPLGMYEQDLRRHVHIIGGIGSGKTGLLKNIVYNYVKENKAVISVEPHGEFSRELIQMIPEEHLNRVRYYDFSDSEYPIPFNFLKIPEQLNISKEAEQERRQHFGFTIEDLIDSISEEFMNIMKQQFKDSWGIRTEKIFRFGVKALLEANEGSIWNMKKLFKNREYREYIKTKIKNIAVRDFWFNDFVEIEKKDGTIKLDSKIEQAIDSPITKLDRFLSSSRILNMVGQDECINFDEIVNGNYITIFSLPKGILKDDVTKFLGNIIVTKLMMAYMARDEYNMKKNTGLVIDELQNFITTNPVDFEKLLDELRKYGVQSYLAHQRINQIEPIKSAMRDNIGTVMCFRVGTESSSDMVKTFAPYLKSEHLENLPNRYAYVKPLIKGVKTEPVLLKTQDNPVIDKEIAKKRLVYVINNCRNMRKRKAEIEKELQRFNENGIYEKLENDEDNTEINTEETMEYTPPVTNIIDKKNIERAEKNDDKNKINLEKKPKELMNQVDEFLNNW